MKQLIFTIHIVLCMLCATQAGAQQALYVSAENGNNRNDGSKSSPFKNIQKAIDEATDGATIYVAQGNYYGLLNKGTINIIKPVKIYGGYSNKQTDLTLPGGGMFLRVKAQDFDDVEQLAEVAGNKTLTDLAAFKGKINAAYLNGFLTATYKESTDYDPNSAANTFRSAMGMNQVGTMQSSATMFANRYPWQEALQLFGAMDGYGTQIN